MPDRRSDFARFTELLRGRQPFPWQAELAEQWLRNGRLPSVIDVPTGLGKTSVIDCWAYALGQAPTAGERAVPLRLCVVVDRRLIVDAGYEEALTLKRALDDALAGKSGELRRLAEALASLSGSAVPLECVRMRGGVTWESRWLARPDQAAVILGTVDQFGSRLLFRGYGASARMRPIDAALVGTDTWLVIDEAHIAAPLVATTGSVARLQQASPRRVVRPLAVTAMTATPAGESGADAFRPDPRQQARSNRYATAAAEARRRLEASKPATLVELPPVRKKVTPRERASRIGEMLGRLALRVDPAAEVVGVLCNTIAAARGAHALLEADDVEAALMIGRSREYEREKVLAEWLERIGLGADRDGVRRFVVATQTIEVGANLDLDAAVCEIAPLGSLIQRFGRVNRIGRRAPHASLIAHCSGYHETDPVYGEASEETWKYLSQAADAEPLMAKTERQLDAFEVGARHLDLGPLRARELADSAPTEASEADGYVPVLLGSDVERWAATHPAPEPEQAVAPFIRGREQSAPEVSVAWRVAPSSGADSIEGWRNWLAITRPVEWEFVSVPIWEARALVAGQATEDATADVEGDTGGGSVDRLQADETGDLLLGVAYTSDPGELTKVRSTRDLRVGSHVILRADLGGHDRWGWTGARAAEGDGAVPDVGDLAPTRRRGVLRLDIGVLTSVLGPGAHEEAAAALRGLEPDDPEGVASMVEELSALAAESSLGELLKRAGSESWHPEAVPLADDATGDPHRAVVLRQPTSRGRGAAIEAISDADVASSSQGGAPQPLAQHLDAVAERAVEFAQQIDIAPELVEAVRLAALWHDLGKADPRFQTMLHDGDELAALLAAEPLAKSGRDPADPLARRAARIAGVPRGFRHEAVSARIVRRLIEDRLDLVDAVDAELVHHLVASHHGCARPLLPSLVDGDAPAVRLTIPEPEPVEMEIEGTRLQVDWEHPVRFEVLCDRYGWWGLALLESLVRLADMLASEEGGGGARGGAPAEAARAPG